MRYIIEPSVTVITPSINPEGSKYRKCCESVYQQSYKNLRHLVVFDGVKRPEFLAYYDTQDFIELPYNTGANGFYGHRIYAACSKLVNSDFVFLLDEDNWYESNHVKSLIRMFMNNTGLAFAHSLRKIYDADGNYLIDDNCESLGQYPIYLNEQAHLVDTSSYAFNGQFFRHVGHNWDFGWGADRRFYEIIKGQNHMCTGKHTLCYRLDGNPNSVNIDFFVRGNSEMQKKYGDKFPWTIG